MQHLLDQRRYFIIFSYDICNSFALVMRSQYVFKVEKGNTMEFTKVTKIVL